MRYLFSLLFLCITITSFSQAANSEQKASKKVSKYLEEVMNIIKKNGLYADSIDWKSLEAKVRTLSKGMQETQETRPVVDTIIMTLKRAGDRHTIFADQRKAAEIQSPDYVFTPARGRYLGEGVGYIQVPGFLPIEKTVQENFARNIQGEIKKVDDSAAIKGWIVDLRGNSGGNMSPMIAGLSSLIGEGPYGYIVFGRMEATINVKTGVIMKIEPSYSVRNPSTKIAVLIDTATGSAGEYSALAFKGLSNVKFFGQPSAGYITANRGYHLSDGSILFLATGYVKDRNQKKYMDNIVPDVITPSGLHDGKDLAIEAAKQWLHDK